MQPQGYVTVTRRPPDIEDYIDIVRRYRSWIVGPAFAGLVIAVVVAFLWPNTYVSTATMRISPPMIPERLVPSNISTQITQRLVAMQQEILSNTSLTELIQRPALDLYKKERESSPMLDVVEKMRRKVKVALIDAQQRGPQKNTTASAFQVIFAYDDRYKAQAVVSALVTKFMEQNVTVQRNQSIRTTEFLTEELNGSRQEVNRLDAELAQFKADNAGRLPEHLQANIQALQGLQMQVSALNETLNRNMQEKLMMETNLQNQKNQLNLIATQVEAGGGSLVTRNDRLQSVYRSIQDGEGMLAAAREKYRDTHPDIRAMEAKLKVLYQQREALERDDKVEQAKAQGARKAVDLKTAQTIEDLKSAIAVTQTQIGAKAAEIEQRVKRQAELAKAQEALQLRIQASPTNEQRYAALLREYDLAKARYQDLSKRKEMSETATKMEEQQRGEMLEVLDAASLPETPAEPDRLIWSGAGLGVGLMLGICLAGVKEMKDSSLKNLKDVRAYTNLPVLTSVPLLENALMVRRRRRLVWLAWSAAVLVGTGAMSASMYYYFFGRS